MWWSDGIGDGGRDGIGDGDRDGGLERRGVVEREFRRVSWPCLGTQPPEFG